MRGGPDRVSLEQAISYLQFFKDNKDPFNGKPFIMPPETPSAFTHGKYMQTKKPKKREAAVEDTQEYRKNLNKNRAIKRIIETSKEILENNYRYIQNPPSEKQSYVTQLNIYLKQYNRLSEQIYTQEVEEEEEAHRLMEEEEAILEQVYNYIVCQDFREVLDVALVKEKISKTNIDFMMDSFRRALVVVSTKEMRVYGGETEEGQAKAIKLFEIENVDYHTQPYIFTVFTITKDKTQGQEYLYFRFDSIENQDKWDRAIYCNYMNKKMKKKSKFFEIEYPEKEDDKQKDHRGGERAQQDHQQQSHLDFNRGRVLRSIVDEPEDSSRPLASPHRDDSSSQYTDNKPKLERYNTDERNPRNQDKKGPTDSPGSKTPSARQPSHSTPLNRTDSMRGREFTKKETSHLDEVEELDHSEMEASRRRADSKPTNENLNGQQESQKKMKLKSEKEVSQSGSNIFDSYNAKSEVKEDSQVMPLSEKINPITKRKVELKKKYEQGVVATKEKFFGGKCKIFYLANRELEYWDYNPKTYHKEEKKIITVAQLRNCKIDSKSQTITFILKDKALTFAGKLEELRELAEWMQLSREEELGLSEQQPNPK